MTPTRYRSDIKDNKEHLKASMACEPRSSTPCLLTAEHFCLNPGLDGEQGVLQVSAMASWISWC